MSTASRAQYDFLQNAPSLKYGEYDVTKDWKLASSPLMGSSNAGYVVFNPNDITQKFFLGKGEGTELDEYLSNSKLAASELGQYFGNDTTGRYDSVFSGQTLNQQAEQKRQQDLVAQFQAGTASRAQLDAQANNTYQAPLSQSQQVYNQNISQPKVTGSGTTVASRMADGTFNTGGQSPMVQNLNNITPTSTPQFNIQGNLNLGSSGTNVSQLQEYINFATGSNLVVDGQYGSQTQAQVKALQTRLGITPDGIVGPKTTQALNDYLGKILKANPNLKPPGNINSGSLQAGTPINLPSQNTNSTTSGASLMANISAQQAEQEKIQTSAEKNVTTGENDLMKLLNDSLGRGADQLKAENSAGLPQLKQQLSNINAQVKAGLAEYEIEKEQYDALSLQNRDRPVTMNSIIGSEASIDFARQQKLNRKASDIGLLQATASGLAGNIDQAQETISRAIDLKYQDKQDLINTKIEQLKILEGRLSKEEQKTANFLNTQYQQQKDQLAIQTANEKDMNSTKLNLIEKYKIGSLNDTIEQLIAKVQTTTTYKDEIRPPVGASGGSGGSSKGSSGSNSIPTKSITALRNALNESKFAGSQADGKYSDPDLYLANYNSYPDKAEFLKLFPPATYINPANTYLPQEIMKFTKQTTTTTNVNPFK